MYAFLTGPALWVTFIIFIGGIIVRVAFLAGLSRERDRVFYNHASASWAFRSIFHWLIPWGSASLRQQPVFALVVLVFHVLLLGVPLFLNAHNLLWDESFRVSLWSMSDQLADILAMVVVGGGAFLFVRRLVRPEVRILTSAWDYTLLLLTLTPFVTGVMAYHHWGPYELIIILHILFSEILLIVIPFSKLGHMVLFFFTRTSIAFEMGGRRGARSW